MRIGPARNRFRGTCGNWPPDLGGLLEHLSRQDLITNLVTLWVVLDPISTIPIFLALTPGMSAAYRRRLATIAVLIGAGVLLFFIVAGQLLLGALGIPLYSFQIAGGIVLFLFALSMVFGQTKPQHAREIEAPADPDASIAVYPLAIPTIAGPGAMLAVVLLTDNARYSPMQQVDTVAMLLAVLFVLWAALLVANPISRVIGAAGANILARVMGLILAAVAVDNVLKAAAVYVRAAVG